MARRRSEPNLLAGAYLHRAALWRKDPARLEAAYLDERTRFAPVWRARSLIVRRAGGFEAGLVEAGALHNRPGPNDCIFLGEFQGVACFAVELSGESPPELEAPQTEFQDLRLVAGELSPQEAGVLAYARAMVHWRERCRFCGRCSAPTQPREGGHVLECTNPACATHVFPRLDPAVIVLVTDGERALLGRQAAWPPGRYSTIAGFVEPGESLEDAVIREVAEETGVIVSEVEYHSSQPWPFPSSLMVGFLARAASPDIRRGDEELEDVRWVTRAQVAAGEVALPTTHSISFRLIEDWFDAQADVPLREQPGARLWTSPVR